MNKLTAAKMQDDGHQAASPHAAATPEADADASRMFARVRLLMIVSGLTTLIAIAAVVAVIGYRVYRSGDSGSVASADGIVALPKGARVIAAAVAGDRIVVTLDVGGATEIRTFDVRTLKQTGRLSFATEP
jgi:hypothetical protein